VDDLDAHVPRCLIPEGEDVVRQVQIVVDGLGDVHHAERPLRGLAQSMGRVAGVVAADGDEHPDVELHQRLERLLQRVRSLGGVGARDADVRAAAEVDAAGVGDGQALPAIGLALHEPLEAVLDADDLDVGEARPDGGGADDAVDSRRGAARDHDAQLVHACEHATRRADRAAKTSLRRELRLLPA
jgi:hypothetical protein